MNELTHNILIAVAVVAGVLLLASLLIAFAAWITSPDVIDREDVGQ